MTETDVAGGNKVTRKQDSLIGCQFFKITDDFQITLKQEPRTC